MQAVQAVLFCVAKTQTGIRLWRHDAANREEGQIELHEGDYILLKENEIDIRHSPYSEIVRLEKKKGETGGH